MKRGKLFQITFLIFITVLVLGFFVATYSIRQPKSQADYLIKSTFLPRLIILMIAVFGGITAFKELRKPVQKNDEDNLMHIMFSVCIMFISVLLLNILGFILVGTGFLFFQILIISEEVGNSKKKILKLLGLSFICSLAFALGFRYGFNIGIPIFPFS